MGTIEERARKYVLGAATGYGADARVSYYAEQAFIAGAESERAELTSWHDPKEELPEENTTLLIKTNENGVECIYLGCLSYGEFLGDGGFVFPIDSVSGWREIHE